MFDADWFNYGQHINVYLFVRYIQLRWNRTEKFNHSHCHGLLDIHRVFWRKISI